MDWLLEYDMFMNKSRLLCNSYCLRPSVNQLYPDIFIHIRPCQENGYKSE